MLSLIFISVKMASNLIKIFLLRLLKNILETLFDVIKVNEDWDCHVVLRMFFKIPPFVFHRIKAIATVLERHNGEQNDDRIVIFVRTIPLNVLSICLLYLNCVIIPSETLFYAYTVCCIHIIVI